MTTKEVFDTLKQAIKDDYSLAYSWHCNVAMMCYDAIRDDCPPTSYPHEDVHKTANDAASRFMRLCV